VSSRASEKRPEIYIGLMSGTSLDGISAAAASFSKNATGAGFKAELLAFVHTAYTPDQRQRLLRAMEGATAREYSVLGFDMGAWLADAAAAVLSSAGVRPDEVQAVASHGQTIWHEPGRATWQLGQAAVIAERLGLPVVHDFRARDVAAGGQGAPLVPIADALLFSSPDEWRVLQNLGGIGNMTMVPPGGGLENIRAFDTGPGVAVIDAATRELFPHLPYDLDGKLASRGKPVDEAVDAALEDPFFSALPPKSTGRELFSAHYASTFIEHCRAVRHGASDEDCIASAVALSARSIRLAWERFVDAPARELVLSGGGARNPALVAAIQREIPAASVCLFDDLYFDCEAKEAVAFAFLACLHARGEPGNVPGATGARGPRILGTWSPA
jgi:anhydro-N-acetylmuramic acid kinase